MQSGLSRLPLCWFPHAGRDVLPLGAVDFNDLCASLRRAGRCLWPGRALSFLSVPSLTHQMREYILRANYGTAALFIGTPLRSQ